MAQDNPVTGNGLSGAYLTSSLSLNVDKSKSEQGNSYTSYNSPIYYKLGYYLIGGMYLGAIYQQQFVKDQSKYSDYSHWGASIGISEKGSYINAHYIFNANKEVRGQNQSGQGYTLELGHLFHIYECLSLGAQISYQTLYLDSTETHFTPMLSVGFNL